MVLDSKCEKLYVCDTKNDAVRCVDMQTKNVITFVGEDPDGKNNDGEIKDPYMDHIKLINIRTKVVSTIAFFEGGGSKSSLSLSF